MIANTGMAPAEAWRLFACVFMYALGLSLMMVADAQKFYTLRLKRGLITDGLFAYTRNPNYLGEIMVYASFALLGRNWFGWICVCSFWVTVFIPNMVAKDISMSRYPEFKAYASRTGLVLPKLF